MFIGIDFFNLDNFCENMNCIGNVSSVQLSNSIVDQISIRTNTSVVYSSIKDDTWNYDEILVGDFVNSLEAGNVNNAGVPIQSLLYMKKKTTDLVWDTVISIPFLNSKSIYQFNDFYVASNVSYDYGVIPVGISGVQGQWVIQTFVPSWDGTFLIDDSHNYRFYYNLKWDAITGNQAIGSYEPIGATKRIKVFGSLDYDSGKITNTLLSDNTVNRLGSSSNGIDLAQERIQMDNVKSFIKNKKAKILKDGQGKYLCIVSFTPVETPNNSVAGAIGDISFDFEDIAEPTAGNLASMNLGNIIEN